MICLSVENLTKNYGDKLLFKDISFGINAGDKVALVARNGAGKSSLLRIITGKDIPDGGEVTINKQISVGFLEQDPYFEPGSTISDYIFSSGNPMLNVIRTYDEVLTEAEQDPSESVLSRLEKASAEMDTQNAWDYEVRVKQILTTFGLSDLHQPADQLSGGQKKRVALSRVLIEEPEFLILDEPTNHLDLDMIEWLEQYLSRQKMTLLLVTHDRYFLDRITNVILELDQSAMYPHKGNYEEYLNNKAAREENEQVEVDKARNLMRKELDWMRRQPKARSTKAKYRVDAFYDLKKKAAGKKQVDDVQMSMKMSRMGKKIMEMEEVNKSFGDLKIMEDFSYTFKRKEKIGIVGKNGVGKSTFLNVLTGAEPPTSGKIDKGETIVFGYYGQKGLEIKEDKRIIDVVKDIAEFFETPEGNISAAQFLSKFQFSFKQQHEYVSTLSGGERRRLYLLMILIKNPNFLILDEPTNDLDLDTLTTLEDFLDTYGGCVIIVTHDRYFLDRLADHLFVFEGEGIIRDFNGKYSEYREHLQAVEEQKKLAQQEEKKVAVKTKSEEKVKLTYKEKQEFEQLEKDLEQLEASKEKLEEQLNSGAVTDHQELADLSAKIGEIIEEMEEKEMRWLELSEKEG